MSADIETILRTHSSALERYLATTFRDFITRAAPPARLLEAIDYSLLSGGKRLRPALLLESFFSLKQHKSSSLPSPLPAATAVELVHTFSLVHDDLPAMDDDDLRRGRPTSHKVFGEAMAILAGDAMLALAFELLATEYADAPVLAASLVRELAGAAGPRGMIGGQVLDVAAEPAPTTAALAHIHAHKTGALITCACRMGAMVAGADATATAALTRYGGHLGLAFQIADDLLDVAAPRKSADQGARKDTAEKNTYPALLGVEGARKAAEEQANLAIRALETGGITAEGLSLLARFAVERAK